MNQSDTDEFLRNHFAPTQSGSGVAFFRNAFVKPNSAGFQTLLGFLQPDPTLRKLVFVDGHPRTGKSWAVVGALTELIESNSLSSKACWSTGQDSLKIFDESSITLKEGIEKLVQLLQACSGEVTSQVKYVLLDDFFGGNEFRGLGENLDLEWLDKALRWEAGGILFDSVPLGSVTIVTGRSFCYLTLETLLGRSIRLNTGDAKGIYTLRWGMFSSTSRQAVEGVFDSATLEKIVVRNQQYHPYAHEDREWMIAAAPLIAFDPASELKESEKNIASGSLFEDDIGNLIAQIERIKGTSFKSDSIRTKIAVLRELEYAYLAAVVPAFAFVGPDAHAFKAIGLTEKTAARLRDSMYYSNVSDAKVASAWRSTAVVPNEFYMRALQNHFADERNLAIAAELACRNLDVPLDNPTCKRSELSGLLLRGFVERALSVPCDVLEGPRPLMQSRIKSRLQALKKVAAISAFLSSPSADVLLRLECTAAENGGAIAVLDRAEPSRGLVAAIGWIMTKFLNYEEFGQLRSDVHQWISTRLSNEMRDSKSAFTLSELSRTSNRWHLAATLFSTLLQWALTNPDPKERIKRTNEWIDFVETELGRGQGVLLKAILLDELVWAILEHAKDCGDTATALLEGELEALGTSEIKSNDEQFVASSMMLSLSWHNAWRAGENDVFDAAATYSVKEKFIDRAKWLELAHKADLAAVTLSASTLLHGVDLTPLLVNLQYHWLLFTTQRAHWMRDWCFQDNPIAFENTRFSQVAAGSSKTSDNESFACIVDRIVGDLDEFAIRNILLMVGTRRHYFEANRLREILVSVERISERPGVKTAVLQAIYELQRQGFLDEPPIVESDFGCQDPMETRQRLYAIEEREQSFLRWCNSWFTDEGINREAWIDYKAEVETASYLTDLKPQEDGFEAIVSFVREKIISSSDQSPPL